MAFDASEQLVADLRAGYIDSIVVQDPFRMGYESTRSLALYLAGKTPPAKLDSGAYLVTRENIDTREMQALVFPDIQKYLKGRGP